MANHIKMTDAKQIRNDWYQTETHVIVTILAKRVDNVKVMYSEKNINLSAKLINGENYYFNLNLSHYIVPEQCTYKIFPSKIEIKLKKQEGFRWNSLEDNSIKVNVQALPAEVKKQPPKYPSSCKKSKDWDKVEKELEKQEAEEKPEGEDALNALFQQIYGKGSDDVRRAMNKSFQESGGTVLSTNWSEVGKGKVDRKSPDGLEWKSWDC